MSHVKVHVAATVERCSYGYIYGVRVDDWLGRVTSTLMVSYARITGGRAGYV